MPIDKNKFQKLSSKKKAETSKKEKASKSIPKVTQGFQVGQAKEATERTTFVIDRHNLELLEENAVKLKKTLKRRGISRSSLARIAIAHFNSLSHEKQIDLFTQLQDYS